MKYSSEKTVRSGRFIKVFAIILIALMLIAIAVIGYGWSWYQQQLKPLTTSPTTTTIVIPEGASTKQIAQLLEKKKIIRSALAFEWYVRQNNLRESLQAGNYVLDSSQSVSKIVTSLSNGKVKTSSFTILPAKRVDQIEAALIKAGYSKDSVAAALNAENYKNHPALAAKPAGSSLEGYLYPETFQITATTTPTEIVKQSLDEMAQALSADTIDKFKQQGLSPYQAITLASIVEKEVSNTDDRRMVARVFLNRLKMGIALGSDVTYHYIAAVTGQEPTPYIDSPYNTRKYTGLPPGPISNVSKSSLNAVANPAQNDYLFFVAGDDGKTYYSRTNAEHLELVRQHCKILCSTY